VLLPQLDLDGAKHARQYLDQLQVDPDYRRVGEGGEGNCNCNIIYYYLGPNDKNPAQVFSGPGLTLLPSAVSLIPPWDNVLDGEGASDASGRCNVAVHRYWRDREPYDNWKISSDERALVASGRLAVLSLYVMCDRDVN
jgi:hypothetical protein